ncbi:MAG: YggS family pyridoxal phosphate-dependent enzyme, partial [Christensenellaceae bacterium]
MSIAQNVQNLLSQVSVNPYGEAVTVVAAVKFRTPEEIQECLDAGITAIGDNHVQEFKEKCDLIRGGERHFIGHLQTNKVKYLIGKVDLYQSLDRDELATELSKRSARAGVVSSVLVQVNIGSEESKGGYAYDEAYEAALRLSKTEGLSVKGFMAMLPLSDDEAYLASLVKKMRALYERTKEVLPITVLSMGMSGD